MDVEEGEGRKGRVTCTQKNSDTHTHTPCGTAVNHILDELAWASRELGRIICGGVRQGEEGRVAPIAHYPLTGQRWHPLAIARLY